MQFVVVLLVVLVPMYGDLTDGVWWCWLYLMVLVVVYDVHGGVGCGVMVLVVVVLVVAYGGSRASV